MYINNNYINPPNEIIDINKFPNYYEENEFISNLMLNPQKYREFKRNINRINNIDNEINYLKSLEKNTQINFLDNIIISEEEYQKALKDEQIIFQNLTEDRLEDLLSHKKLLSHEKHLLETMSYILGYESFDWNMLKKILNIFELKTKMQNIDYSKIKKKRINILLGKLCRSDRFNKFLNMNDFCDSGFEFIYEWVKVQLKIYFYLYQNKHQKFYNNIKSSKSMVNIANYDLNSNSNKITPNISEENDNIINSSKYNKNKKNENILNKNKNKLEIMDNITFKNSTNLETIINSNNSINNNINNNISNNISNNSYNNNSNNKSNILITSLPYIMNDNSKIQTNEQSTTIGSYIINSNKSRYLKEAKKVSFKLKGFNKEKEKLLKEIKTAEMLPLLKNKTFPQMRNYFEERIPFSKKVEQRMKNDIDYFSLNGTQDEKKMLSLIASGKMKAFNLESLFKLKNILKS